MVNTRVCTPVGMVNPWVWYTPGYGTPLGMGTTWVWAPPGYGHHLGICHPTYLGIYHPTYTLGIPTILTLHHATGVMMEHVCVARR